jgi:crossover junction endodeoxyribonuclease RusA
MIAAPIRICLPWPNRNLSPNARLHFIENAQRIKAAKETGYLSAREAGLLLSEDDNLELDLTFCSPDHHRRDADNVLASLKGYLDGIFLWGKTDDNRVKRIVIDWGIVEKNGTVYARIQYLPGQEGCDHA